MNKRKIVMGFLFAAVIVAGLVWLLIPKDIHVEPVTKEEQDWAKGFLQGTLNNPDRLYADFLEIYGDIQTPAHKSASRPEDSRDVLEGGGSIDYLVTVPEAGLYGLTLDCAAMERSFTNIVLAVSVNGIIPYAEANNIDIPLYWADDTKTFPMDSYGDETVPGIRFIQGIRPIGLYNNTYLSATPILFWLEAGENRIALHNKSLRSLALGMLTVEAEGFLQSYADTGAAYGGALEPIQTDATLYQEKNSTFVQLSATNDVSVSPTHAVNRMVNILEFNTTGGEAAYSIDVPATGYYALALHADLSSDDFPAFCGLKIDGETPFAEAAAFPLPAKGKNGWQNIIFADNEGNPYYIYLAAGKHQLSLRLESEPIAAPLRDLRLLIEHINQFSLDVKKVAGKETDKNRTWRLSRYMPETEDTLKAYDILLRDILSRLGTLSPKGTDASTLSGLVESVALVEKLLKKPDELPLYLELLSGDRVSVLVRCGNTLDGLMSLSFTLDEIYLYDGVSKLPRENPPFYAALGAMGQQLIASFVSPKYAVRDETDAVDIWMNSSVVLADSLQKLADSRFTPETGIKVNISIMPDQNKLVLASAAGTQPDIAMAIEHHIPFDLAVRDALYDMTQFDDFWEIADRFIPGAMVPYIFNDGIYALAESLDFYALVYREDIFESLGLSPPDTWYDVCEMMSELQRFDMSFYMPIASGIGYKWFHQTSPLIYQFGGSFYQENGLGTEINLPGAVEGISFLGELFTTYALSEQVPSFFNAFRYGQTPVGLASNADYILLKYGAPELTGQWSLGLPPGIPQEDGSVSRWYIANGRAASIFASSDMIDESWEFLKWWTRDDIQNDYAFTLLSTYGYIFLPGNQEALESSYLPDEDKQAILGSIQWLRDVPRSPGQYMLERTLSDIWNQIVFDNVPPQVAIDIKAIDIQREFLRKMTEFGYADDQGNLIKPYAVRELDWYLAQLNANRTAGLEGVQP